MDLSQLTPLRPNPGGEIPFDQVVGRDALIDRIWRVLEDRSVVLGAERRMGKTCILKRMRDCPRQGWVPVFSELEKVHTLSEFVEYVANDLHAHLSRGQKTKGHLRELWKGLGGIEVGGFLKVPSAAQTPWKRLFLEALNDAVEQQSTGRVLLMWDEFPSMIEHIRSRDGDNAAMELLDTLRAIRETQPRVRMILCGSVGIHNVLTILKAAGYGNSPLNNMDPIEVTPLERPEAIQLAARLLLGVGVSLEDLPGAAAHLADAVSHRPFFIHRLADQLGERRWTGDPETIDHVVELLLLHPDDPLHLRHHRDRIAHYYTPARQALARRTLDVLALAEAPINSQEVLDRLPAPKPDRDELRDLLQVLAQDHYLHRGTAGYEFRFPIVRRWWRADREL